MVSTPARRREIVADAADDGVISALAGQRIAAGKPVDRLEALLPVMTLFRALPLR